MTDRAFLQALRIVPAEFKVPVLSPDSIEYRTVWRDAQEIVNRSAFPQFLLLDPSLVGILAESEASMARQFRKWRNVALFACGAIGLAVAVVIVTAGYDWASAQDVLVRR